MLVDGSAQIVSTTAVSQPYGALTLGVPWDIKQALLCLIDTGSGTLVGV